MNQQKLSWINNLRLLAMFAVVVLHTASPLLFNYKTVALGDWMAADVYNAVTRFAVPVFVMITGALVLGKDYELGDFLKKRLGRLLLPFLFWSLVYVGYQWYEEIIYFNRGTWGNISMVLHQLKIGSSYHLWYVYLLVGLYLVIPIISKFVRNASEKELLYFLAIWFITILISSPYLTRFETAVELRYFSGYTGYLVLGYYLANKQFNFPGVVFMAALIFICFATVISIGTYYLEIRTKELSTYFYEPVGPFVVMLSVGGFLIAKNIRVIIPPKLERVFANTSKFTLGIYFSHALILNILDLNGVTYAIFNPWLSIPLVALLCFVISWLLIYVMSKVPVVKHLAG
ncbi:acyltransferase family protein [Mucilaginibacter sp. ZT4R22]|uniref:Acyltransferase family protein n=1 Tax=Mucilaginibacter pankratovii TaxID=2772110 RepID=A0ABR7WL47_9SPHI|nr:acyltransferase family protein [Mucilaginibacter pankratovii]MBD1363046.1 acyltransferase family protein [Mucilaginibacter pankratovii]